VRARRSLILIAAVVNAIWGLAAIDTM